MVNSTYVGRPKEGKSAKQTAVLLGGCRHREEAPVRGEDGRRLPRGGRASPGPLSAVSSKKLGEGSVASGGHEWQDSPAPPLLPSLHPFTPQAG